MTLDCLVALEEEELFPGAVQLSLPDNLHYSLKNFNVEDNLSQCSIMFSLLELYNFTV